MTAVLAVAAGGAVGATLRYLVSGWGQGLHHGDFPTGTLLVNVLGCLAFGVLAAAFAGPWAARDTARLALLVGVLGGFTTFSSFGWETFTLIENGEGRVAALYVGASNVLGLVAIWGGWAAARALGVAR